MADIPYHPVNAPKVPLLNLSYGVFGEIRINFSENVEIQPPETALMAATTRSWPDPSRPTDDGRLSARA